MKTRILHLVEGAREATGAAIIIDVFRAFSLVPYAFAKGCRRVIPVGDVESAYSLQREHPEFLVAGERFTKKLPGFDFGNSPTEIVDADLEGMTLVHTTHAGTQGLVNASRADAVFAASFVNATATVEAVLSRGFEEVSIVCMGHQAERPTDEDTLCAEFLSALLAKDDPEPGFPAIRNHLKNYESAEKFFDPAKPWTPERDFELCLALDAVAAAVELRDGGPGGVFLEPAFTPTPPPRPSSSR